CKDTTKPFSVLYLDLDRFNIINDSLGYQVGDDVLKTVANRLISTVMESAYIAHINSNDFIIIIENFTSKDAIFSLAEKIMNSVGKGMSVHGYELYITASIGICFFPEDGNNKHTYLKGLILLYTMQKIKAKITINSILFQKIFLLIKNTFWKRICVNPS